MATTPAAARLDLESYRRELTGHCYRMLGSPFEAEDAVQETMLRAWRGADGFDGRAAVRSWLYRIATNVCLDMLRGPQRRARPMDLVGPFTADDALTPRLPESAWVLPAPDERVLPDTSDPAELATLRESIRLAFVAALQHLPPRQRAVLILREVLCWQSSEVAALLDTSVASVNSALQRARATMGTIDARHADDADDAVARDQRDLLRRYVSAFERYDVDGLVALLHDDAAYSMPPHPFWLRGPVEAARWMRGPGAACHGSRVITTAACGGPAVAVYRAAAPGLHEPFALVVIETSGGRISGLHHFLDTSIFRAFGLPPRLHS